MRYATYNNPSQGGIYSLNSDDDRIYGGGGFQYLQCGANVTLRMEQNHLNIFVLISGCVVNE